MTQESDIIRHDPIDLLSMMVVHKGIVYLSGLTAEPPDGKDVEQQTRETLASIDTYLTKAGTDRSRLLTAQIWLADIADFDIMNQIWIDWLDGFGKPTRACVEARLAGPHYKVEIMVSAAIR